MIRRPWIILVTLLILFMAFSGVVTFRYLNRSNALRDRILAELSAVDGTFTLRSASISPNSLILNRLTYTDPDSALTISVDRVSLRASVTNLVRHQGKLNSVLQSISLTRPTIAYRPENVRSEPDDSSSGLTLPSLTEWKSLERVILLDGRFRMESRAGEPWVDVHDIEGWVLGGQKRDVEVRISAALAADSVKRVRVDGEANLDAPSFDLRLTVDPMDLELVDLPSSSPVYGLDGLFQAGADVAYDSSGLSVTAQWTLEDGRAVVDEYDGLVIDQVNLSGLVENQLATVQGDIRFEGDRAQIHGSLGLDGPPVINASATLNRVHIGRHLGTFTGLRPEHQPRGTVWTTADFSFDLTDGKMDLVAVARGDSLWTPGGTFDDITLDYSWDNRRWELRFDKVTGRWYGLDLNGSGRFRPSEPIPFLVTGDVAGTGDSYRLPPWTAPIESKSATGNILIRNLPDEGFVISGEARVRNGTNPAFGEFRGRYSRYGYDARLDLYSLRLPDAMARITQAGDGPVHVLTDQPQQVLAWWDDDLTAAPWITGLGVNVRGKIEADSLIAVASVRDPSTGGRAQFNSLSWLDDESAIHVESSYRLHRDDSFVGNGQLAGTFFDNRVTVDTLTFLESVHGQGSIDLSNRRFNDVLLTVDGLDLEYLLPALTSFEEGRVEGTVNGRITVDGPFELPNVDAHLDMAGGRVGELSDYWGLLTLHSADDGLVHINQGAVGRAGVTLFTVIGDYSLPNDSLDLYLEHPGSEANVIFSSLAGSEDLVVGQARFRGMVRGKLTKPSWRLQLGLEQGEIAGIDFAHAEVDLRGETNDRIGHVVYVDSCRLVQPDRYEVNLVGAAPLSKGAGDLELTFAGNLLELLPQLSPFIVQADGQGNLRWVTTIVAGEPVASRGELTLTDGTMRFQEVFPPLTDLDIALSVDARGQTTIERATAVLDNTYPLEVTNEPGTPGDSTRQSIYFGQLEIDLGVLKARTLSDRGLPFRLPGISTTDEYARLTVAGKQGDWLTIAGPADSLYVDGELELLEATFTYPPILEGDESDILNVLLPQGVIFPDNPGGGGGAATPAFINNARWDVNAYIGHDVEYERIVKGLENAPFLETFSGFLGQLVLNLDLEPTERDRPVRMSGSLVDESFRLEGTVISTTGRIEVLDLLFEVDRAEVVFDRTSVYPLVSMRATTTVVEEETPRPMSLTLYVIDPVTGERQQRGRWGEFTFVLEDELGSSQEEVLSAMGVGIGDITQLQNRLLISGAGGIDRAVARRYLAPLEREAADWLGLDLVQVRPQFATNLVGPNPSDLWIQDTAEDDQRIAANTGTANLFRGSRIMLGKYIDQDIFISYTGQFGEDARYASVADIQLGRLGLLQKWNLEYRMEPISPNFVIELGWEYESVEDQNNRSARVKYTVLFDLMQINRRALWRMRF